MWSLMIGFVLDVIIGDPHNPYHPVRIIGSWAMNLESVFRKIDSNNLKLAGALAWLCIIVPTFLITLIIVKIAFFIHPMVGILFLSFS